MSRTSLVSLQREVDGVRADQSAHEQVCAERYKRIDEGMAKAEARHQRIEVGVAAIALGLISWLAAQVWEGRNHQPVSSAPVVAVAK